VNRARARIWFGTAALVGWTWWPAVARAAPRCEFRVIGPAGSPWTQAAGRLDQEGAEGSVRLACREVILFVNEAGATLEFRAENGGTTLRRLEHPSELESTVLALSFVATPGPNEHGSAPGDDPGARSPPVESSRPLEAAASTHVDPLARSSVVAPSEPRPRSEQDSGEAAGAPARVRSSPSRYSLDKAAMIGIVGGVRTGGDQLVTPMAEAFFALATHRVELGVMTRYEARHLAAGADHAARGYGMAVGVRVARRQPVSSATVLLGGQAELAAVTETARSSVGSGHDTRAEPRIGAYTGLVLSKVGSAALRTTLGLDVVPDAVGGSHRDGSARPLAPWWAVTWGLGGEFGGA
jgi:hypothetical protein